MTVLASLPNHYTTTGSPGFRASSDGPRHQDQHTQAVPRHAEAEVTHSSRPAPALHLKTLRQCGGNARARAAMGRLGFHASRFQRVTLAPQAQLQNTRRGRPETQVTRGSCCLASPTSPHNRPPALPRL
eukprot:scaffold3377_cov105-Isochrysis_galbana.AAC.10